MKESWRKQLEAKKKEVIRSAITSVVVTIALSFWYFFHHEPFVWRPISPIAQPGFLAVEFYGIIAYFTIGAFLFYVLRFWQLLKYICVDIFGSWEVYNFAKWVVRIVLFLITQFYIVPTIVNWLNAIISFFYNIWFLLLYISPLFGLFIILFPATFYLVIVYKKYQIKKKTENP